MQHHTISGIFNEVFDGMPNFMTPTVVGYGKKGGKIWEISSGRGMGNEVIYGVTVIDLPRQHRHDLSQCFTSLDEAKAYIKAGFQHEGEAA